tara:strand:+ start:82 stop:276 length:195 start_codon:yes stop_codon:yes gene_type:complete
MVEDGIPTTDKFGRPLGKKNVPPPIFPYRQERPYDAEIRELIFMLKITLGFLAVLVGATVAVLV